MSGPTLVFTFKDPEDLHILINKLYSILKDLDITTYKNSLIEKYTYNKNSYIVFWDDGDLVHPQYCGDYRDTVECIDIEWLKDYEPN